jgi:hypothetical protein
MSAAIQMRRSVQGIPIGGEDQDLTHGSQSDETEVSDL